MPHAPVRVHIFTAHGPTGFIDEKTTMRESSVKDLRTQLARIKTVRLVETPDEARLQLEVLPFAPNPEAATALRVS